MNDQKEDMQKGECCDICASYFVKDGDLYVHGHPATCWDCWDELSEEDRLQHTKASIPQEEIELSDSDKDYEEVPFEDDFEGNYTIDGVTYEITIKGICGDDSGKNNFYTVAYSDGTSRDIDYEAGTGWVERGVGQTAHSVTIGKIVEAHFS